MSTPRLILACRYCGWRPSRSLSMGVVNAHFETEHDGAETAMDMLCVCPVDGTELSLIRTEYIKGGQLHNYDCVRCMRSYRLRQGAH